MTNKEHIFASFAETLLVVGAACMMLTSCSFDDDDTYNYDNYYNANALVTVKRSTAGVTYLQLNDSTTLLPTNTASTLFGGKEVRALVNYRSSNEQHDGFSKAISVVWIDSIRTKSVVELTPQIQAMADNPLEIVNSWITCLEDGYLTLQICTYWGTPAKAHRMELVAGTNAENPYELVLRQDAQGDLTGTWNSSIIAFRLDKLPANIKNGQEITLKWTSYSGTKTARFKYGSATNNTPAAQISVSAHGQGTIE